MLELPTLKTDFLFENSQNFNQTTHARSQYPIVFIDIISLYFNCTSSVKYLFKWSRHGHAMPFSAVRPKHKPNFERQEKCLCIVWNASFCLFYILKWQCMKRATRAAPKIHNPKYFSCYIILELF